MFCGRVFIFLFQSFPLGDKSSVNLRGEFHVENTTSWDEPPTPSEAPPQPMEIDVEKTDKASSGAPKASDVGAKIAISGPPEAGHVSGALPAGKTEMAAAVDVDQLYPVFWALQQIFSNPTRIFDGANFESFKEGLGVTMRKFADVQTDLDRRGTTTATDDSRRGTKRRRGDGEDAFASGFNPKYLTSRDLFELEVGLHDEGRVIKRTTKRCV